MAKWTFEPGHTAAEFSVRHMMVTFVRGHFKKIHGTLEFDPQDPQGSSVKVKIEARGIWSGEAERDDHLRSADFLDAGKNGLTLTTKRNATSDEVLRLKSENEDLKKALADAMLNLMRYKKSFGL